MADKEGQQRDTRSHGRNATHSEDGVDITLIRWMLSLTPEERIKVLEANVYSLKRLKDGILQT